MSRSRQWRRWVAGAGLVPALLLAACGDDDSSDDASGDVTTTVAGTGGGTATTAPADDDVDPNGVLRIAFNFAASGGIHFDPIQQNSPADFQVHYHVYDTLLRQQEDGSYEPGLAKEAKVVDPHTITVTLQEGVKFQDGTDLGSDDVIATIQRTIDANKPNAFRMAELSQVDTMTADSPTQLTIKLKTPIAGSFYNLLAHNETMPLSKDAIDSGNDFNTNPVGAGPFKLVSQDNQKIVLEKWDGYFQADQIKLAGVEWVQVDNASLVLALRSGTVDAAFTTIDINSQLEGSDVTTRSEPSPDNVYWMSLMCEVVPEFRDVRVRQALNFAVDKDAINQAAFAGKGTPMSQFWAVGSPFYDERLADAYDYDLDKAKALLAEAGADDLRLRIPSTPGQQQRISELLQAAWTEAGLQVEIVPVTNAVQEVYIDKRADFFHTGQNRFWTDKITRTFLPGSIGTTCDPKDPAFTQMVADLRAVDPGAPEAVDLWKQVSRYLSENAYGVWLVNGTVNNAYDGDRVGNPMWTPNQVGQFFPDVHKVYIKA